LMQELIYRAGRLIEHGRRLILGGPVSAGSPSSSSSVKAIVGLHPRRRAPLILGAVCMHAADL
jgi:hypothetical protein